MKKNVGRSEKIIRLILAVIFAIVGYLTGIWWLYIVTALLLVTAAIGYCPLWVLLKIDTTKKAK